MHSIWNFLKTTALGGLVVLLPVVVAAYLVVFVAQAVVKAVSPLGKMLGFDTASDWGLAVVIAIALLIASCFVLGLAVRTTAGRYLGVWLERRLLQYLPGYDLLKLLSRKLSGKDEGSFGKPVLVRNGDVRQIGFLMEELPDQTVTVFVPVAPAMTVGWVYLVQADRIERLSAPLMDVFNCLGTLGCGAGKLMANTQR
jgi:uncharacterized membrane protein